MENKFPGVYCIKLEDNRFYIGASKNNVYKRALNQLHKKENCSNYIREYSPVEIEKIIEYTGDNPRNVYDMEETLTLLYMKKHGYKKVRGSNWCLVRYRTKPESLKKYDIEIEK